MFYTIAKAELIWLHELLWFFIDETGYDVSVEEYYYTRNKVEGSKILGSLIKEINFLFSILSFINSKLMKEVAKEFKVYRTI